MRRGTKADDIRAMEECLRLARKGAGRVSPNPMVGAILVKSGRVVGRGYHRRFGDAHAEVNAILSAGRDVTGSTLFVNLEPCCHFGKTPPCTDMIRFSGIRRVVVAMKDPNPLVAGKGIRLLRKSGIRVEVGLMREEAETLNEAFIKFITSHIPFVTLKIAQTFDGRISDCSGASRWITGLESRKLVHNMRSEHDAVLVGAGTVLTDDPSLTVRHTAGNNPVRVVLDGKFRTSPSAVIYRNRASKTILFTSKKAVTEQENKLARIKSLGVEVVALTSDSQRSLSLKKILQHLANRGITSILVEGGAGVYSGFVRRGLADKIVAFIAPKIVGQGLAPFSGLPPVRLPGIGLTSLVAESCDGEIVVTGYLHK